LTSCKRICTNVLHTETSHQKTFVEKY
jgi:hypothetical protein